MRKKSNSQERLEKFDVSNCSDLKDRLHKIDASITHYFVSIIYICILYASYIPISSTPLPLPSMVIVASVFIHCIWFFFGRVHGMRFILMFLFLDSGYIVPD